ncbi:MAG: hypothetical protein M9885_07430 [Burkholderiaceae bacterium]|nr:hypothetical protein [Burkholderiaceae bacterium]
MGKPTNGGSDLLDEEGDANGPDDQHLFGGVWSRIKLEALARVAGGR